jgi:hypothetical protein
MKILLSEMPAFANELIQLEQLKYNNGRTILKMLNRIGLSVSEIDNWQAIEQEFTKDYQKATLQFNLQVNGIETEYREAEAFYLKNRNVMTFEEVTPEQIEDIRENCRVYADSPAQILAHGLITTVVESLNRLDQLGVKFDFATIYEVSRLFEGDTRATPKLKVNQKTLVSTLVNLK